MTDILSPGSPANQFFCFSLASELYAVPILKVREIQATLPVTRIPHTPPWMLGVTNLRGAIVPVLDMRTRFALGAPPEGARPVIVMVELQGRTLGLRVDGVSDVVDLPPGELKAPPDWGGSEHLSREFIQALAPLRLGNGEEQMLILLDLDRLLSIEELGALEATLP